MANHVEYTLGQVINYLTDKFAKDFNLSKTETKRYLIDALTYNIVVEALWDQVDYLVAKDRGIGGDN